MTEDPKEEAKRLLKHHLKHTHGYYLGFDKTPDEEIGKIVDLIVEAANKETLAEVARVVSPLVGNQLLLVNKVLGDERALEE